MAAWVLFAFSDRGKGRPESAAHVTGDGPPPRGGGDTTAGAYFSQVSASELAPRPESVSRRSLTMGSGPQR